MAIAHVNHTIAGSTTGSSVTSSGIDTTGADLIVVSISYLGTAGTPAISDSKSNTWTALTARAATMGVRLYYCFSPTTDAAQTFTATLVSGRCSIGIVAFSGANAYDSHENGATAASGTSLATGSITPSQDNCLVVAALCVEIPSSAASIDGTGFTAYTIDAVLAQHVTAGIAWKVQGTAAAENRTWSWTQSRSCAAAIADWTPTASAVGTSCYYRMLAGTA